MTAPTSQKLADVLRVAGFEELAVLAEKDAFHDYLSEETFPQMVLADLLAQIAAYSEDDRMRLAAHHIRMRLIDGEFDASEAESAAWAQSEEGQAAFKQLKEDK